MSEKLVQSNLIKHLKSKGFYVIKTHPGLGTPTGCPDVIALGEGFWIAFECKDRSNSKHQPLQKETINKLNEMSFAWVIHNDNYKDVIKDIDNLL